eukprot:COSAG06_NODE_26_length_32102_cov_250.952911_5_plen_124_part_00
MELIRLGEWLRVGYGSTTIELAQLGGQSASRTQDAWMLLSANGYICTGNDQTNWSGRRGFCAGDTIGLSLGNGELVVFRNGVRQGVACRGLCDGPELLRPVLELQGVGDCVRVVRREEGVAAA